MKKVTTILIMLFVAIISVSLSAQTKKIDLTKSKINWVGKKVTGQHEGTINFKDGALVLKKNKLTGGKFTVDMTSLTATDLTGEYLTKLNGHLKSDDFFGVEKFTTAKLIFKKIAPKADNIYTVIADLTIKGKTNPVTFDITVSGNTATTTFKVDRTKYDIKYGSGSFFENLGDKTIDNEFTTTVILQF